MSESRNRIYFQELSLPSHYGRFWKNSVPKLGEEFLVFPPPIQVSKISLERYLNSVQLGVFALKKIDHLHVHRCHASVDNVMPGLQKRRYVVTKLCIQNSKICLHNTQKAV